MLSYGSLMEYDITKTPIIMKVKSPILGAVANKFETDYQLPFSLKIFDHDGSGLFTFDASVDDVTFLRHLKTGTPEEYASLAKD